MSFKLNFKDINRLGAVEYSVYEMRPIYAVFFAHFITTSYPRVSSVVRRLL